MARDPKLDRLFDNAKLWWEEAEALRGILLECGLTQALKWRSPATPTAGRTSASSSR